MADIDLNQFLQEISPTSKVKFKNKDVANEFTGVSPKLKGALAAAPEDLTLTSAKRTPETNAAAGGVPNSYHLKGDAVDLRKPVGESDINYFKQQGYKTLDEGDHIHVEPNGQSQTPLDLNKFLQSLDVPQAQGQQQGATSGLLQGKSAGASGEWTNPGGPKNPLVGLGLQPGITLDQLKSALPFIGAIVAPELEGPALALSPLGAMLGKAISNQTNVLQGEQQPAQNIGQAIKEPAITGGEYLGGELAGRGLGYGLGKGYQALVGGKDILSLLASLGKGGATLAKIFQGKGATQAMEEATQKVAGLPEELGIGAARDVKQIAGDNLRDAISAPKTGINAQVSQAYESAKNPILLKYGAQAVPAEQLNNLTKVIDDKAMTEVNPNILGALNTLKQDIHPDMTLMDLYQFQKKVQNVVSSGGEEAGAIGKIYQPIKSTLNETINKVADPEEAKLFAQADKSYAESKDVLSRFEGKFNKNSKGFARPQPGESIFDSVSKDITKNPSLIESSIAKHPELKEPLADIVMTDIANKVGFGNDINKVVKFYNMDRLKEVLPPDYFNALDEGLKNINKLNPLNKQKAISDFISNMVRAKNKTGQAISLGGGLAGQAIPSYLGSLNQ